MKNLIKIIYLLEQSFKKYLQVRIQILNKF